MTYRLTLTENDIRTIWHVGGRYGWSEALISAGMERGDNEIPEHAAWELAEAFASDEEGGHAPFPMLDGSSDLCRKLFQFWNAIV